MRATYKTNTKPQKKLRHPESWYVQKPFAVTLRQMIQSRYIFQQNPQLVAIEFTSTNDGGKKSIQRARRDKEMGYRAGWFDLTLAWRFAGLPGEMAWLDAKWEDGGYTASQKDFIKTFLEPGKFKHAKFNAPILGFKILREWGIKT